MKHVKVVIAGGLKSVVSDCGGCSTSCQSACKTSCTVGNQTCDK